MCRSRVAPELKDDMSNAGGAGDDDQDLSGFQSPDLPERQPEPEPKSAPKTSCMKSKDSAASQRRPERQRRGSVHASFAPKMRRTSTSGSKSGVEAAKNAVAGVGVHDLKDLKSLDIARFSSDRASSIDGTENAETTGGASTSATPTAWASTAAASGKPGGGRSAAPAPAARAQEMRRADSFRKSAAAGRRYLLTRGASASSDVDARSNASSEHSRATKAGPARQKRLGALGPRRAALEPLADRPVACEAVAPGARPGWSRPPAMAHILTYGVPFSAYRR